MVPALALALLMLAGAARAQDLTGAPIEEGATSKITFQIQNDAGVAVTPLDVLCWVDDVETGTRILAPFAVTPAVTMTTTLAPAAHKIVTTTKGLEEHVFTCQARYPAGCTPATTCEFANGHLNYNVENLHVVIGGAGLQPSPAPTPVP